MLRLESLVNEVDPVPSGEKELESSGDEEYDDRGRFLDGTVNMSRRMTREALVEGRLIRLWQARESLSD